VKDTSQKQTSKRHRVQVDLNDREFAELQELQKRGDHSSHTETVRAALKVFDFFVEAKKQNASILSRRKDGSMVRAVLL